jgi:hypothetical protein
MQTKDEQELLDSISGLSRRDEQNPAAAGARVRRAIAALEVVKVGDRTSSGVVSTSVVEALI